MTVRFRYRAARADGETIEGILQAPSAETVVEQLHRQRLYPVTVEAIGTVAPVAASRWSGGGRQAAVAEWTRVAAILLRAGMPVDGMLEFTARQSGHAALATVLGEVRAAVRGGAGLADAMERHPRFFQPLHVAMIRAGEAGGALEVVFARLAEHLEESAALRSEVRAALLYPVIMAVVAAVGVAVLMLFVVPRFTVILAEVGGSLPATTRVLIAVSGVLARGWFVWAALFLAIIFGARRALASPGGRRRWHAMRLHGPVTGDLERKLGTARFTRTLGMLLESGVPILPALRIARTAVPNEVLAEAVGQAADGVAGGGALAGALGDALPPLASQLLAVGEESGRLEEMCLRVAETYDTEVRRTLRTAVALVEPAMIILFGGVVGFVALAMLQAIYSINAVAY